MASGRRVCNRAAPLFCSCPACSQPLPDLTCSHTPLLRTRALLFLSPCRGSYLTKHPSPRQDGKKHGRGAYVSADGRARSPGEWYKGTRCAYVPSREDVLLATSAVPRPPALQTPGAAKQAWSQPPGPASQLFSGAHAAQCSLGKGSLKQVVPQPAH